MSKKIEVLSRGVLVVNNKILLCRSKPGYYYLPGGHVEFGESAEDALRREFLEENGRRIRVGHFLVAGEVVFRQNGKRRHELNFLFHVELIGRSLAVKSLEEGLTFEWHDRLRLSTLDLRPASLAAWLCLNSSATWLPAV